MKKAGYERGIFLHRLVEETPESEESGENNHGTHGGGTFHVEGTQGQCPQHGHVLGLFRENREARLAGVSYGESRQGRGWWEFPSRQRRNDFPERGVACRRV